MSIAALSATGLLAAGWVGLSRAMRPGRVTEPYVPEGFGLTVEHVRFPSQDGTPLAGWFIPGSEGTVILLHGYGRSKGQMLPQAAFLHRAGYGVLLLDFRSRGESGGNEITFGVYEPLDVLGAVDYLRQRADVDGRIAAFGTSLGAVAAVLAAARTEHIQAVIIEAAYDHMRRVIERSFHLYTGLPRFLAALTVPIGQWRLGAGLNDIAPVNVIGQISPRPVLIIHGLDDIDIPPAAAEALFAAAAEPKELWLVPDAAHCLVYQTAPYEYEARVLAFLRQHLADAERPLLQV